MAGNRDPNAVIVERDGHTKENCFAKGGGKEGQWPPRNLNDVNATRMDTLQGNAKKQLQVHRIQSVSNSRWTKPKNEDKFDFFIGSTTEEGINTPDDKDDIEESDEWINCAGSKNEDIEEFLIDKEQPAM